jgi:glucokinase
MSAVIGIDVGGTSIKAVRVAADGAVEEQVAVATPSAGGDVAEAVRLVAAKLKTAHVAAAGVVVPGALDHVGGVVRYSANLDWRDVPLRALLSDELGVPVVVDNDVIAAALAESWGSPRLRGNVDGDLLYVALGTGIGGAHVHEGAALRGARGMAGEIGHVPVHPDGEACSCGQRGCLEVYASAAGVARRYAAAGGVPGLTAADLSARLHADPIAAQVWQDAAEALGLALASAVLLLDPSRVVLGGGLAESADLLLVPVRAELTARLTWRPAPPLERAALGLNAGSLGAALLARQLISTTEPGKAGSLR